MAITTVIVEAIADHEAVGNGEAHVVGADIHLPAGGLIQQHTAAQTARGAGSDGGVDARERPSGVEDIVDDEHVAIGAGRHLAQLNRPAGAGTGAVAAGAGEFDAHIGKGNRSHEVGNEAEGASQQGYDHQGLFAVVMGDAAAELTAACSDLVRTNQWTRRRHERQSIGRPAVASAESRDIRLPLPVCRGGLSIASVDAPTLTHDHSGACRWLSVAALVLALVSPVMAQQVHREVLPSGLTLIVQDSTLTHAVELRATVRAGPVHEGALLGTGASAMLQHLLLSAVRAGTVGGIEALRAGSELRVERTSLSSTFALTTSDLHVNDGLRLLAAALTYTGYDRDELELARGDFLQQVLVTRSDAASFEERTLAGMVYRVHPARVPPSGLLTRLQALDVDQLQAYQRRRFTAPNTIITVVGNVDIQLIREQVTAIFAGLSATSWQPDELIIEPPQYDERHAVVFGPVAQLRHAFAWRTASLEHRDQPALTLAAALLDHSEYSPLRAGLAQQQLAERVHVHNVIGPGAPGFIVLSYDPIPDRGAEAWRTVQGVLDRLAREGPGPEGLKAAKRQLVRERLAAQSSVAGIAAELERWELAVGVPSYGETFHSAIEAASAADVQQAVAKWLHYVGRNRSKVVIQPQQMASGSSPEVVLAPALDDVAPRLEVDLGAGVRLLHRRMPLGIAHLRVAIAGGAAADPDGQPGVAEMLAELLSFGSDGRNRRDLERLLAASGMELETRATAHTIEIGITCFPDDVPRAIEIIVDLVKRPALPEGEVQRLVQQRQARLSQLNPSDWQSVLERGLRAVLFDGHYAGVVEGSVTPDRAALLAHFQKMAVGQNVAFSLYGDFDPDVAVADLTAMLAADPAMVGGEAWQPTGAEWTADEGSAPTTLTWDEQDAALALAWRWPPLERLAEDEAAMDMLHVLLVGSDARGGRFAKALLEAKLTAREFSAITESYAGRGLFALMARVEPAKREALASALREAVAALIDELEGGGENSLPLAQETIDAARDHCLTNRILEHEDQQLAGAMHLRALLIAGAVEQYRAYGRRLERVTREDLLRVARTYLAVPPAEVRLEPATVAVPVTPEAEDPVMEPEQPEDGA